MEAIQLEEVCLKKIKKLNSTQLIVKRYFCGLKISRMNLKNIAIIAHVDHGKTTLVDKMLLAGKLFSDHETPGDLIMDSNDLEKERGITITC